MHFTRLRYRSFRNLDQVEIEPAPGFNIFWGRNAQGKTNLLEGIYLLGHLKSFRGVPSQALIGQQHQTARIDSELITGGVSHSLSLTLGRQGKELQLDGKRPQRLADVTEKMRQVLFAPEEVVTVKGAPALRRNLLDRAIYQQHPAYLERMQHYVRILKQRNHALRMRPAAERDDIWLEGLIQEGTGIRAQRARFLQQLQPHFAECYRVMTGESERPEVRLRYGSENDPETFRAMLREEFARCRAQEQQQRTTMAGPHRDDPGFFVNGRDLRSHGSQGQQRTFVLAYKVALLNLLHETTGKIAVMMLDDIAGELDETRRHALFTLLEKSAGQVFLTTTDPALLQGSKQRRNSRHFEVVDGQVFEST